MKSIASLLSIIALGLGLVGCPGSGGGSGEDGPPAFAVSTTAADYGVVGNPYTSTLAASGGTAPFTWAVHISSALPNVLLLDVNAGVVSGTPTTIGTFDVTFTVMDSTGQTATGSVLFAIHPKTDLVSINNGAPPLPVGSSSSPSISNNGRFVAFASSATIIPGVSGPQIYLHDWQTNQTSLVSQNAVGIAGNGTSSQPSISADGRFVAFTSTSGTLTGDPDPGPSQIFLRDMQLNTTTLVSQATGVAGPVGNGASIEPTISDDGRFVAFASASSNLTGDPNSASSQIFLRDTQLNITTLVSQATGVGVAVGDGASSNPTISDDGQFVAFTSLATTLAPTPNGSGSQIFLRDTIGNATSLVSREIGGDAGNGASSQSTISDDGRYVAFTSLATTLAPTPNGSGSQIFLRDTIGNATSLVSREIGGDAGNGASSQPTISADGGFVAFTSLATILAPTPGGSGTQIFLRNTQANTTALVSQTAVGGGAGSGASSQPTISANGGFAAFSSVSTNLGAPGGGSQIYVRALF